MIPRIDLELCIRCKRCLVECPTGAVLWKNGAPVITEAQDCVYCGLCEDICPTGAVQLVYEIVAYHPQENRRQDEDYPGI